MKCKVFITDRRIVLSDVSADLKRDFDEYNVKYEPNTNSLHGDNKDLYELLIWLSLFHEVELKIRKDIL